MPFYLFLRRLRRSPAAVCGLIALALLVFIALFAPWLAPVDPNWQDAAARLQAPNDQHWLGTDGYGRDLLSRLIYGTRSNVVSRVAKHAPWLHRLPWPRSSS